MKYDLQVVSLRNESFTKELKRYVLDGVPTIGAFGDEPYEIRFHNRSNQKVQLRLSIDGTDILSGAAATTGNDGRMWVVDPYQVCRLRAWPEGDKGGASFLFVSEEGKTVAAHTHGDTSHRGIIAAAVFTEAYVPPPSRLLGASTNRHDRVLYSMNAAPRSKLASEVSPTRGEPKGLDYGSLGSIQSNAGGATMDFMPIDNERRSVAGTGAGAYVEQKLGTAAGLVKPTLDQVLRVRYLWWDEVKAKLAALGENFHSSEFHGFVDPTIPSGFPGNKPFEGINLGGTPRPAPVFERFAG